MHKLPGYLNINDRKSAQLQTKKNKILFRPLHAPCRILVRMPLTVETQSPNHWDCQGIPTN